MTGEISALGYPMMGLGNLGLGSTGAYTSYDNYMPSMLSMTGMGGYGGMSGLNSMGGLGMMGMYNPAFMAQMMTAQQQIEQAQLIHAGNMHEGMVKNEVRAVRDTDSALIAKILTNSSVQQDLQNLYNKVIEGDQDGICTQFDKLREQILNTYKDEIAERGSEENPRKASAEIIEKIYSQMATAWHNDGTTHSLRDDIVKYGESAMFNGYRQGLRPGHQERYVDETMMHCFGLEINEKESKDLRQTIGKAGGRTVSVLEKAAYGGVAGATAYTVGKGALSVVRKMCGKELLKFKPQQFGKWAFVAAGLAAVADIAWQISKD